MSKLIAATFGIRGNGPANWRASGPPAGLEPALGDL